MARPKTVSDEEILSSARRLFTEKGSRISTREIAEAVGLSQPALFKRFKTRENLFTMAMGLTDIMKNVLVIHHWVVDHPKPGPFEPELEILLNKIHDLLQVIFPRIMALHSERHFIAPGKIFAQFKTPPPVKLLRTVEQFIEKAQQQNQVRSDIDPSSAATVIVAAIQGRVFYSQVMRVEGLLADEAYFKQTADFLSRGLSQGVGQ